MTEGTDRAELKCDSALRLTAFCVPLQPAELTECPRKAEGEEGWEQAAAPPARKHHCLKLTQIGTEKSRGPVLPGGEFVLLMRVT